MYTALSVPILTPYLYKWLSRLRLPSPALTDAPMMMKTWASDWWNSSSSCSSFLSSPNTSERERGILFVIFPKKQTKRKNSKKKKIYQCSFHVKSTITKTNTDCTLPNGTLPLSPGGGGGSAYIQTTTIKGKVLVP